MIGFYALALLIIGVLVYIPYAEWAQVGRLHLRIAGGCLLGAGMIAWSILPRPDRFEAPGPPLFDQDHPELFECLRRIADRTGQEMPREIYLVAEMNAWVSSRGGFMGFGSRRVMGLGLPLMQVVSVAQLEAILAHEFGHYHGGDTRLGPWIYKTRAAIDRTLDKLGEEGWLHLPFRWYGRVFLRITHGISRAQEFAADRLAATVVGSRALIEGLRTIHSCAPAYDAYWQGELAPVLDAGRRPPIVDGFDAFLRVDRIREAVRDELDREAELHPPDPLDTHPPLAARIEAVGQIVIPEERVADERPATVLLGDLRDAEDSLFQYFSILAGGAPFQDIDWDRVPEEVFLPRWREQARALSEVLAGVRLDDLPGLLRESGVELTRAVLDAPDADVAPAHVELVLSRPIGACLVDGLMQRGWQLSANLGDPVQLRRDGRVLEPFSVVSRLLAEDDESWWDEVLRTSSLSGLELVAPTPPAAAS